VARHCGQCTLCCKLVPVRELEKPAGQRCRYQRMGKGCTVYHTLKMPVSCHLWNCRWLVNDDTADLRRPDFSHYVIDVMPDYVTAVDDDTGNRQEIPVIQIWVDPRWPDAWRDPALLAYLDRRGKEGFGAIVRFDNVRGIGVFPPSLTGHGWVEKWTGLTGQKEHNFADVARVLSETTGERWEAVERKVAS
jgi:hypothetical protein